MRRPTGGSACTGLRIADIKDALAGIKGGARHEHPALLFRTIAVNITLTLMLDLVLVALGMSGLAVAMLGLAWVALGEYRSLFLANPKLLMSLEVFAVAAEIGGPGYVAAIFALCGLWLLMLATIIGIVMIHGVLT